jgi:hypothetical protein
MTYITYETTTGKILSASNKLKNVPGDFSVLITTLPIELTELVNYYYIKDNKVVNKLNLNVEEMYEFNGDSALILNLPEDTILRGSDYELTSDQEGIELVFENATQEYEFLLLPPHPYNNKKVKVQIWQNII